MAKATGTTKNVGASKSATAHSTNGEKKIPLNQITVSSSSYEYALGKKPKGTGNWAFSIGSKEAENDITKAFWHYGSFKQASAAAKKEAQRRGKTIVYVMS